MNFDRVAEIYDETRGLPEDVMARVVDRIVSATQAEPTTRILELGIGTGRISAPLVERGYSITGVDISTGMMDRLRQKVGDSPNLTLVEADVTELPFPNDSFDVILTFHVLHLVPEWKRAMDEARRVLAPGGYFVTGGNAGALDSSPFGDMREQWRVFTREAGAPVRPDYGTRSAVDGNITEHGGRTAVYVAAQWDTEMRPIDLLEAQRNRTFSQSWDIPDEILESVYQQMLKWTTERFGSVDRALTSRSEFVVSVSRFPRPA